MYSDASACSQYARGSVTPARPTATAVVVTYNSSAHVLRCLAAAREARLVLRVVDNASSDGTPDLVARHFPDAWLRRNDTNVGFAAAVNHGLADVATDVVLLLNPDCELAPGSAAVLLQTLHDHADAGIVGPRLVGPDGRFRISAHPFESWRSVLASRLGGSLMPVGLRRLISGRRRRATYDACRADRPGPPVAVDWLCGACIAIRTDLLTALGGLDAGYFLYYEDEELCLSAWQHGAGVLYQPAARAMHVGGASSDDPCQTLPHLYQSMLRFFHRHRRGSYQLVRAVIVARALVEMATGVVRTVRPSVDTRLVRTWWQIARLALAAGRRKGSHSCAS
jgi:N-acetylglucosaminyl-diphospho-decaprenol L-rhamnosyltransferase